MPTSRWGHSMVAETDEGKEKVYLFGGINLNAYSDSSVFELTFSKTIDFSKFKL